MAYGHDPGRDALIDAIFSDDKGKGQGEPWAVLDGWLQRLGVSTDLRDYGIEGEEDFQRRVKEGLLQRRGRNFLLASGGGGEGG